MSFGVESKSCELWKRKLNMKTGLTAVLVLALSACAGSGTRIDSSQLNEIRKGQTTVTEIVKKFGRPNLLSKNWDGTQTAAYATAEGRSDAASLLPLMGAVVGGGGTDSVIFYFDSGGVLTDYKTTKTAATSARAGTEVSAPQSVVNGTERLAPNTARSAEPVRANPARKPDTGSGLPFWLPSEIRDVRQ